MQPCKNCGKPVTGAFCSNCGEKLRHADDRTVRHLLHEGLHFITHLEGTFFTTFRTVLARPGKFSEDYCNGIRKKYFKPLSFFLLLVILYLLFPLFSGLNMDLKYHMMHDVYGEYAERKVQAVMGKHGLDADEVAVYFHQKGEKISKFLLFILIPAMALFSLLIARKRRLYYDHFIFSIEAVSILILWGYLLFPLLLNLVLPLLPEGIIKGETVTGIIMITGFIVHTTLSARRFFGFKYWISILFAIAYTLALFLFVQYVYKFILFFIAINLMR